MEAGAACRGEWLMAAPPIPVQHHGCQKETNCSLPASVNDMVVPGVCSELEIDAKPCLPKQAFAECEDWDSGNTKAVHFKNHYH
jgi:hypothetical protein